MRKIKLQWLFFATIVMTIAMSIQWRTFNAGAEKGIIALEFAKTVDEAKAVTTDWNISAASANTYLDFIYLVVYASFLFAAVYRTASLLRDSSSLLKYTAVLAPLAAIFDVVENIQMLRFLNNPLLFTSTYYIALIKFGLIGLLLVLFVLLSCRLTDQQMKRRY